MIDPQDGIDEHTENNNLAMKEIPVLSGEGITMTTDFNTETYQVNQDVKINVNLKNAGIGKEVIIKTYIEDENDNLVAELKSINTFIPYATEQEFNLVWNTGNTYAGIYRVHVTLNEGASLIAENRTSFQILPDIDIDLSLTTDKISYGPHEEVFIDTDVKNSGQNYIIPELMMKVKIRDSEHNEIYSDDLEILNLMPNGVISRHFSWDTELNPPGEYTAVAEAYVESELISSRSALFEIEPRVDITGIIEVMPSIVFKGDTIRVDYTISNKGNIDAAGVGVKVHILDPDAQVILATEEEIMDIRINGTRSGRFEFSTESYSMKTYLVILSYSYFDISKNIASVKFTVKDSTPALKTEVKTDKAEYAPVETVQITAIIHNISANYSLQNVSSKVMVMDGQGLILYEEESFMQILAPAEILKFVVNWNTSTNPEGVYTVRLEIRNGSTILSEAQTIFEILEVKPSLDVTKRIPDLTNLLVWVNEKCERDCKQPKSDCEKRDIDENAKCTGFDLLERILNEAVGSYYVVYDEKDFRGELRNPCYTDILILGDYHPLEDHFGDELREKVYSGTGIISSLWLKHGKDEDDNDGEYSAPIFGVRQKGKISGQDHLLHTVASPITRDGIIDTKGDARRVEALDGAIVAAWIQEKEEGAHKAEIRKRKAGGRVHKTEDEDDGSKYPAIILNEYGNGRAIYYAFDLGETLDYTNFTELAAIIKSSLTYVHKSVNTDARPHQVIPVEVILKSLGRVLDLRIEETYSPEVRLYDPVAVKWVDENPWTVHLHLEADEMKATLLYALMPDKAGTYELRTGSAIKKTEPIIYCRNSSLISR
ncbi:MAG: hypothetical protein AB1390_12070 [Nitrospirota bacterium]